MKMSKILMAGAVIALGATTAHAATDGALDTTSIGTADISLIISELVQITGLDDMDLDNGDTTNTYSPGNGDVSDTTAFCVHYNNATGVNLQLDSTNGAGAGYLLDDGGGNQLTYVVEVDEGNDGGATPHAEAAVVAYAAMASTVLNCGGADNNSLETSIVDTGAPLGVPNGTYTDTLTFTVTPNP